MSEPSRAEPAKTADESGVDTDSQATLHPPPGDRGSGAMRRRRTRAALFVAIALLYLFSIPWYREDDAPLRLILGLPDWVAVALGCYVVAAVLNCLAWLITEVPERLDDVKDADGPRQQEGA